MKTKVQKVKQDDKPKYPIIAKRIKDDECVGILVIFFYENEGTVLHVPTPTATTPTDVGEHDNEWESCFDKTIWEIIDYPITITFEP